MWVWLVIGALLIVILCLCIKIRLLQKGADEIAQGFVERLAQDADTNTLISITTRDRAMRRLATAVNRELRTLRKEHLRYVQGDAELKTAVTNISHDLRTPLTAICGYLELLKEQPLTEDARRYAAVIQNRAGLMRQLTEELMRYSVAVSKAEELKLIPVDLVEVLEESMAAFYTELCAKNITPEIDFPPQKVIRMLDRDALSRIFSNLLTNAVRYSDGDLSVTLTESGEITFANTAASLNAVQVGKLFDRFYTVEAARNSTGLGLSIARTLTEQMGGSISAAYEDSRLTIRMQF